MTTQAQEIITAATGWAKLPYGLPCELQVQDWRPNQFCHSRWVVILTAGGAFGNRDVYMGEFDNRAQANRAAGQYRRHLHAVYDRVKAKAKVV